MTKAIAPIDEVRRTLQSQGFTSELSAALPAHVKVEKFQRVAMSAIQQNPALLKSDRKSLFASCMTAAQLGLFTDGFLGEAYLVPYKGKVQFQPGYRGLIKLVRQSGDIGSISSNVVYENDHFDYELGDDEHIRHKPVLSGRGDMIFVYAIAKFKDGSVQRVVLTREDVMKIKKSSQSSGSDYSPWNTFEEEMWKKTAIKRLSKLLPLNTDIQQAIAISDQADIGNQATLVNDNIVVESNAEEVIEAPTEPKNLEEAVLGKGGSMKDLVEVSNND